MASRASTKPQDRRPLWIWFTAFCAILLVVPTFIARCLYVCKDARDPSGKFGTIGREVFLVMLQKLPLPGHLFKVSCHKSTSDRR